MPLQVVALLILFALFIFFCGAGHMLRTLTLTGTIFDVVNAATAFISLLTALYLVPLTPNLMNAIDESISHKDVLESRSKLMTFMSFMCHEIRNPLFAITSTIAFMEDEQLTPDMEKSMKAISQSANLMLRLVRDVLDISKLESGKLELEEVDFNLREMIDGVSSGAMVQIIQKHGDQVHFNASMSDSLPEFACGDSIRVLQILYNLLSNACKFTSEGRIDLDVSVCDLEDALKEGHIDESIMMAEKQQPHSLENDSYDHDKDFSKMLLDCEEGRRCSSKKMSPSETVVVKLEVKDTGCGIAPDRQHCIYKAYYQSKLSDYRIHGGTGLGLSILKRLLDMMGGTINVKSAVGEGSTFTVYLPLRRSRSETCNSTATSTTSIEATKAFIHDRTKTYSCCSLPSSNSMQLCGRPPACVCQNLYEETLEEILDTASTDSSRSVTQETEPTATNRMPNAAITANTTPHHQETPSDRPVPAPILPKKPNQMRLNLPRNDALVLVVDDNTLNRKLIGRMLDHFDVEYKTAVNGQDAIEMLEASRNATSDPNRPNYGFVIMDLQMPVCDGIVATNVIRKRGWNVPIVALTANALDGYRDEAMKAGATAFMTKPIMRSDLYDLCRRFLVPSGSDENDENEGSQNLHQ